MGAKERLEKAVRRRDEIKAIHQRLCGQLDGARTRLAEIEKSCRKGGVEPDEIDSFIEKVETIFDQRVTTMETRIEEAEEQLAPYLGGQR